MSRYDLYPPDWFTRIRPAVLHRDKYRCTRCGMGVGQYKFGFSGRVYKIVLHIAHLDHDKENWDVKYSRLATMCQCCHLLYDNLTDPRREANRVFWRDRKGTNPKPKYNCDSTRRKSREETKYYFFGETKAAPR